MPTNFSVNAADLAFILNQIRVSELHAGTNGAPMSLTDAIAQVYGLSAQDAAVSPFGLRTVDGRDNNLLAGQSEFGAADTLFPRLLDPIFMNDTDGDSIDFDGPGPAPEFINGDYGSPGTVIDADPRTISNLIVNQTVDNPAALDVWFANPLSLDQFEADHPGMTPVRPGELTGAPNELEVTNEDLANIYNQSPDIGLSPGFNAWMTFFGQFFDHGLDLVTKGNNGTVYIPLEPDDPLYVEGSNTNFMALTRATVTYDENGIPQAENTTTPFIDQNQTYTSHSSHQVFIREYTRMDLGDGDGMVTRSTGHLLDGTEASGSHNGALSNWGEVKANAVEMLGLLMDDFFVHSAPLLKTDQYGNFIAGENGYAQVAVVVTEMDGGVETSTVMFVEGVEGGLDLRNLANILTPSTGTATITSAQVVPTNHQFLVDIAHHAAPGFYDDHMGGGPVQQVADADIDTNGDGLYTFADIDTNGDLAVTDADVLEDTNGDGLLTLADIVGDINGDGVINASDFDTDGSGFIDAGDFDINNDGVVDAADRVADDHNGRTFDNEMLESHYITGDGRGNENIALTTVHSVFHAEHNRLVDTYKDTVLETGDLDFINEWLLVDITEIPADTSTLIWDGARLFQAGRFVTEMQYQHLVFEEFARTIQPNVDPFVFTNDPEIDASIVAEFAHTVYRFGHSMLGDTVDRLDNDLNIVGGSEQVSLIDAFLNPQMFVASGADLGDVIANIARGAVNDLGAAIDEFVVPELQSNLLGLPLDLAALNLARGREQGIPSLNETRSQLYNDFGLADLKPYESWIDFAQHIKNPTSIINFMAAYGTHDAIEGATTLDEKREAAMALLFGDGDDSDGVDIGGVNYTDRQDFLHADGAFAGGELGGMNNIDLWIGGLAEELNEFGGMLGSTFNFIFEYQMEHLQTGDRFYYLSRTQGTNLLNQLEPNTFTDLVMRNSSLGDEYATHLNGSLFTTPDQIFEVDRGIAQADADPEHDDPFQQLIDPKVERHYDNPQYLGSDGNMHDDGGFFRFSGGEHVVIGGTEGNDELYGDKGIDTLWGDGGDDYLNAGMESDNVFGGEGDDIIEDPFGDDVLRGEGGNDVISAGSGLDLIFGGEGNDYIIVGQDDKEAFADEGDDFIMGGTGNDFLLGGEGNDWIEGGDGFDVIAGENSELFFNSPLIGHDVAWGQGGDQDYDLESGDDIAFTGPGIQRFEGMFGFDWAIGKYEDGGTNIDMSIPIFVNIPTDILKDRFDQMEAASGWIHDDVLEGDDRGHVTGGSSAPDSVPTELFNDHRLTQEGIDRIDGLSEWLAGARETLYGEGATDYYNGNILMGGDGSDVLRGRGGNDLLDGDSWLNVRISVDMGEGVFYSAESLTTDTNIAGPLAGKVTDEAGNIMFEGRSLSSLMLDRTLNPGQLSIVREILVDPDGSDDIDTAVFQGTLAEYEIEGLVTDGANNSGAILTNAHDVDGDGWIMVRDRDTGAVGATIVGPDGQPLTLNSRGALTDDTDLIRNIEQLEFADQTLVIGGDNTLATGLVTISDETPYNGAITPYVGQVLTPTLSMPADVDGLTLVDGLPVGLRFEWQTTETGSNSGWTTIQTSDTYTVRSVDPGHVLRAVAVFEDDNGVTERLFSTPTGDPTTASVVEENSLEGTVVLGAVPFSLDYDGLALGAGGDIDLTTLTHVIRGVDVSAADAGGGLAADGLPAGGADTFSAGGRFTVVQNGTDANGNPIFQVVVANGGRDVLDYETQDAYQTVDNQYQIVIDSYADDTLTDIIASRQFTILLSDLDPEPNLLPSGAPILSDMTPTEGQELTSDTSGIADGDGLGPFTYQWQQSSDGLAWSDIVGATAAEFTPEDLAGLIAGAQAGEQIRLAVSFTDGGGVMETVYSDATGPTGVHRIDVDALGLIVGTNYDDHLEGLTGNDILRGYDGDDLLVGGAGNDILQDGAGSDTLVGGNGNDVYHVHDAGDIVVEEFGGGNDRMFVYSDYVLNDGAQVESLRLTASAQSLTGNEFGQQLVGNGGDNILDGAGGNDVLIGGAGADTMIGGLGNDAFYVDNAGDVIVEAEGQGSDRVLAYTSYELAAGAEIEVMRLLPATSTSAYSLTGNEFGQTIVGNAGDNTIIGAGGNDRMYGREGNDLFVQTSLTDGRNFVDGGAGTDTYQLIGSDGAEDFTIYTRAAWLSIAGNTSGMLAGVTEIVVTRNGSDVTSIIAELDNIEELIVDTLDVSANDGNGTPNGGASGTGDTITVVGDFTATSLDYSTITINSGAGNDMVDITALTSDHRIVFNGGTGDSLVGAMRPQDFVSFDQTGFSGSTLPEGRMPGTFGTFHAERIGNDFAGILSALERGDEISDPLFQLAGKPGFWQPHRDNLDDGYLGSRSSGEIVHLDAPLALSGGLGNVPGLYDMFGKFSVNGVDPLQDENSDETLDYHMGGVGNFIS